MNPRLLWWLALLPPPCEVDVRTYYPTVSSDRAELEELWAYLALCPIPIVYQPLPLKGLL